MALYEITFLTKEESDPGIKAAIEAVGGTIENESSLGRKHLAYPIKKQTQAVYTSYDFAAPASILADLNRRLSLNTEILRYLIVTKEQERADKAVTKTVREAIAAAEKLGDTVAEDQSSKTKDQIGEEPVVDEIAEPTVPAEPVVAEITPQPEEPKPARKPRAKKATSPADTESLVEVTEEDRLKALEDKLGEILKD